VPLVAPTPRPLHPHLRALLYINSALVTLLGLPLFLFPRQNQSFFPWPIDPPITAAFLGANYLAAGVLEFAAARRRTWPAARVAVPGVLFFTILTCILTLQSLGALDTRQPKVLAWLAVYTAVPPVMGWLWWRQTRPPGRDETRTQQPPTWVRMLYAAVGLGLWALGLALLAFPEPAAALWPWTLTPSDSLYVAAGGARMEPYVGAWLIGLGTVAAQSARENDTARLRPVFLGGLALAALQTAVLLRFSADLNWSRPHPYALIGALTALTAASLGSRPCPRRAPLTHPAD
jgi:hypothetical protein